MEETQWAVRCQDPDCNATVDVPAGAYWSGDWEQYAPGWEAQDWWDEGMHYPVCPKHVGDWTWRDEP